MKVLIRAAAAAGVLTAGLGIWAGVASAAPAVNMPAANLPPIYPSPTPTGVLPPAGSPGVTVVGIQNCPDFFFTSPQPVGFQFLSGNAVLYQIPDGNPQNANGANAEGTAVLLNGPNPTAYVGQAHLWFGQNSNAKGESYFGETVAFQGATPDGHTISIHANPGFITSASGNQSGWGVLKVTCT